MMKQMTPRTDDQIGYDGSTNSLVRIAFARQLETELNTLQQWKDEQLAVEATWDAQAVGNELGLPLGSPIRPQILPAIIALRQMVHELRDALSGLADNGHTDDCMLLNRANAMCDCGVDAAYTLVTKANQLLP